MITNVIIVRGSLFTAPWNTVDEPLLGDSLSLLGDCKRNRFGDAELVMKLSVKHRLKPRSRATPISEKRLTSRGYRNKLSQHEQSGTWLYRDYSKRTYSHLNDRLSAHASITTSKGYFWSVFQGCGWHSYTDTSELLFPPHANRHQNIQAQEDFLTIKRCPPKTHFISSSEKKT